MATTNPAVGHRFVVFGLGVLSVAAVSAMAMVVEAAAVTPTTISFCTGGPSRPIPCPIRRAAGLDTLDHGKRRPAGRSAMALRSHQLPGMVGNGELAALAGVDPISGLAASRPVERSPGRQANSGLGDRGLGPGCVTRSLLAALLSSADRRRLDRRGGLLRRRPPLVRNLREPTGRQRVVRSDGSALLSQARADWLWPS